MNRNLYLLTPFILDLRWSHSSSSSSSSSNVILTVTATKDLLLWFTGSVDVSSFKAQCPPSCSLADYLASIQSKLIHQQPSIQIISNNHSSSSSSSSLAMLVKESDDTTILTLTLTQFFPMDPTSCIRDMLFFSIHKMNSIPSQDSLLPLIPSQPSTPRAKTSKRDPTSVTRDKTIKQRQREESKLLAKEAKDAKDRLKEEHKLKLKEEKERLRLEKERKLAPGSSHIMDLFVKRAPVVVDLATDHPVSGLDSVFADYNPRKSMVVFPVQAWPDQPPAVSEDSSMVEYLRRLPIHQRRAPVPENVPADAISTLFNYFPSGPPLNPRFKLLQFCEDRRPAFWGTMSKPYKGRINPRRPWIKESLDLAVDPARLDYEYDSEAEWEQEEEADAEDIMSDDEDDDEGSIDDGTDELGWLVNHSGDEDGPAGLVASRRVKRCLNPVIIGPFFLSCDVCPHPALLPYKTIVLGGTRSLDTRPLRNGSCYQLRRPGPGAFPIESMVSFIRAVHGNGNGVTRLVDDLKSTPEFVHTSKVQLEQKLKQISVKEKRLANKPCFYVRDEILSMYGLCPATLKSDGNEDESSSADETYEMESSGEETLSSDDSDCRSSSTSSDLGEMPRCRTSPGRPRKRSNSLVLESDGVKRACCPTTHSDWVAGGAASSSSSPVNDENGSTTTSLIANRDLV